MDSLSRSELVTIVIKSAILGGISLLALKWTIDQLDPTRKQKKEAHEKAQRLLKKLGIMEATCDLTEYEMTIAAQLVDPASIETTWNDIAGLEDVIEDIKATVILPLKSPEFFSHSELHQAPKGVLLHGPPGCGKTMLAKATAREAGARFINLEVPALTDKWYGESQKLAAAVFTLAIKVQPCIIFIDEIDSFLRSRSSQDHEATAMMKAQFMMLWDGISSSKKCQVVVMGATNRPQDVDKAILRRMPAMFQIGLPKKDKRLSILELVLQNEKIEAAVDLDTVAGATEGFSGSDLKELCRNAAMIRVRDLRGRGTKLTPDDLRDITVKDFEIAIRKMKESKVLAAGRILSMSEDGLD